MSREIEITLLGTGTSQGIPVIGCHCRTCTSSDPRDKRFRTAAYLKVGEICLLIDIGPDFRAQMLANQFDDVHAVLVTHEHNDHVSGLDDIRPVNFLHRRDIPFYSGARTLSELEKRFYYAFDPAYHYPGKPRIHGVPIDDLSSFMVEEVCVIPIPLDHGGLDIYGFRIGNFGYITDAKVIPTESLQALQGLDVLVLNALRYKPHQTHLNIEEAIAVCNVLKPKKCVLTHISHDMGLHTEVDRDLPDGISLGYDGMTLKVS